MSWFRRVEGETLTRALALADEGELLALIPGSASSHFEGAVIAVSHAFRIADGRQDQGTSSIAVFTASIATISIALSSLGHLQLLARLPGFALGRFKSARVAVSFTLRVTDGVVFQGTGLIADFLWLAYTFPSLNDGQSLSFFPGFTFGDFKFTIVGMRGTFGITNGSPFSGARAITAILRFSIFTRSSTGNGQTLARFSRSAFRNFKGTVVGMSGAR